ncbi:diguanylate cyclase [Nisaea sp.]|uniref:sensor domain-containing diguanylate cyclase n=1 Tax=Nisaea sp. TaxID=2024842 RepID=UPI003B52566B
MNIGDFSGLKLKSLLEHAHIGVVIHRFDTSIVYANPTALRLLGMEYDQILGRDAEDPGWYFIDEFSNKLPAMEYPVNKVISTNGPLHNEVVGRFDAKTHEVVWYLVNAYPETESEARFIVVTFNEITEQRHLFSYRDIVENAQDVIIVTDAERPTEPLGPQIVFVNRAFEELTGYTAEEAIGETPRMLQGKGTDRDCLDRIREALVRHEPIRETILNYSKTGKPYWLDMEIFPLRNKFGKVTHFAAIERDVTEKTFYADQLEKRNEDLKALKASLEKMIEQRTSELRSANYALHKMAHFDDLTGIPNRRSFMDQAQKVRSLARRHGFSLLVGVLDLDHFKKINDKHGHDAGDEVLKAVAGVIKEEFRDEDVYGRIGGEEFAFVLLLKERAHAGAAANRLLEAIRSCPCSSEKSGMRVTASVGMCVAAGDHDATLEQMLKAADEALYEAKRGGRNRVVERVL